MSKWQRRSGIMLAYPYSDKRIKKNFSLPYLVQPKLNGERCRIVVKQGRATLLSSEENEIVSVPHIKNAVEALIPSGSLELDGELYSHGMSLQKIHSIVSRKKCGHPDAEEISFNCFDLVLDMPQVARLDLLYKNLWPLMYGPLEVVPTNPCSSIEEVESLLISYMEDGYEGIVIRDPRANYMRKRATTMLKWKPRKQDCYQIVGYAEEVDQYGIAKGTLGSLICLSDDMTFSVGSGTLLTQEARRNLWMEKEALVGKYAVIRYPALTDRGIPSHPVVIEISNSFIKDDDNESLYYE